MVMKRQDESGLEFPFDNTFSRSLKGFFVLCNAVPVVAPKLVQFNDVLADELGLDIAKCKTSFGSEIFSGNVIPHGAEPLAQVYAGHQFGHFTSQLGDGRALLLGELVDVYGIRRDIQLKGSGPTPFSRSGDGRASLGPVLREYLISEGMHALGVPTTRALAAVTTGETVIRESPLPGAVLTRIASSHIRIGTFQYFAARGRSDKVQQLADYVIARHYPNIAGKKNLYLSFLEAVVKAQASLLARWMNLGFIHGVMNTDNMTVSGETIDYGPCAFMDKYSAQTVFSSIDLNGRYAFANQPIILPWNLARLAETLIPLVDSDEDRSVQSLTEVLEEVQPIYSAYWLAGMRGKIGLMTEKESDLKLINDLLSLMEDSQADFTLVFRHLAYVLRGNDNMVKGLFTKPALIDAWLTRWQNRLEYEGIDPDIRATKMDACNPVYIPRNHKVEEALNAAVDHENMTPFTDLLAVVRSPFEEVSSNQAYAVPGPDLETPYQTFCGT